MIQSLRRSINLSFALAIGLLSLSSLSAMGRKADPAPGDIVWKNQRTERVLPGAEFSGEAYTTVEQFSRMSKSQLRWQGVAGQACLSNTQGILCFQWKDQTASLNGQRIPHKVASVYSERHLFVPIAFAVSSEFQEFSKTYFQYNEKDKVLSQSPRVNLPTPIVEKRFDRYRLTIDEPNDSARYMLEKTQERIWLRFVKAVSEGSLIMEGDSVLSEVRIIQKRHSADLVLTMGENAVSTDVFFDETSKKIIVDIFFSDLMKDASSTTGRTPPGVSDAKPLLTTKPLASAKKIKSPPRAAMVLPRRNASSQKPMIKKGKKNDMVIVIDAGHGGMDPGALGVKGTYEKDINLSVTLELEKYFSKEKGVRVVTTRKTDVFIPLGSRTQIANEAEADLFISIHCNSSLSPAKTGFEVYYLAREATDKAAENVARLENSVVALEGHKGNHFSKLEGLLASMAVSDFINESSKCAGLICRQGKINLDLSSADVKEADFFVLRGAQMPAVLVELGYLSNPSEELKLRSGRYQSQLAKAIVSGVKTYYLQAIRERAALASQVGVILPDGKP